MFAKIFGQIHDSSIASDYTVRLVFMDLLVLADKCGIVDMTEDAVARRTNVPLDVVQRAIQTLREPDPQSRTKDHEGRRLLLIDEGREWGWKIANYEHYRDIRTEEERREYHKQYKRKQRAKAKLVNKRKQPSTIVNNRQQSSTMSTHIDTDTDGDGDTHMGDSDLGPQPTAPDSAAILCEMWVTMKSKGCNAKMREHLGAVAKAGIDLAVVRGAMEKARSDIAPWGLEAAILDAAQAAKGKDYSKGWQ